MIKTEGGLYGNYMRKNRNKRQVNKTRIKIHDSSASDTADPYPSSDHVGGRVAGGGKSWGGGVFAAHLACWDEFFLNGKTWPCFLFPVSVGIARGGSSRKPCFSRYVSFATHVKFCACWKEFFFDGKTWPGFLFPVLVGIARGGGVQ